MPLKITDKDRGMQQLRSTLSRADGLSVAVGWIGAQAPVAAVHEFGTADGHIPERAPLRKADEATRPQLEQLTEKVAGQIVDGRQSPESGAGIIGQAALAGLQRTVRGGLAPPSAPATVRSGGASQPLVGLLDSATYAVRRRSGG